MSEHATTLRTYLIIFAALLVLTIVTVAIADAPVGNLHLPLALTVAGIKATLVVLFFMHVIDSSRFTWVVIGAAAIMFMVLLGLTMADYIARPWLVS